jgi:hypothetical protein
LAIGEGGRVGYFPDLNFRSATGSVQTIVRQGLKIGIRDRPIRESGRAGVRACRLGWLSTDQLLVGRGRSVGRAIAYGLRVLRECQS